jgi:hypothetical protein
MDACFVVAFGCGQRRLSVTLGLDGLGELLRVPSLSLVASQFPGEFVGV